MQTPKFEIGQEVKVLTFGHEPSSSQSIPSKGFIVGIILSIRITKYKIFYEVYDNDYGCVLDGVNENEIRYYDNSITSKKDVATCGLDINSHNNLESSLTSESIATCESIIENHINFNSYTSTLQSTDNVTTYESIVENNIDSEEQ